MDNDINKLYKRCMSLINKNTDELSTLQILKEFSCNDTSSIINEYLFPHVCSACEMASSNLLYDFCNKYTSNNGIERYEETTGTTENGEIYTIHILGQFLTLYFNSRQYSMPAFVFERYIFHNLFDKIVAPCGKNIKFYEDVPYSVLKDIVQKYLKY